MSIAKHVHSLQQHLARFGLQALPPEWSGDREVFKICFLNKYEIAHSKSSLNRKNSGGRSYPAKKKRT
jgi:hypothetical protein